MKKLLFFIQLSVNINLLVFFYKINNIHYLYENRNLIINKVISFKFQKTSLRNKCFDICIDSKPSIDKQRNAISIKR